MKRLFATASIIALLACLAVRAEAATAYDWTGGAAGTWETAGNWNPGSGPPDASTHTATIDSTAAGVTVTLTSGSRTVNQLVLLGSNGVVVATSASRSLTFSGASPGISVSGGSHSITCPVVFAADTVIYIASGATLTLDGSKLSGSGLIIKAGPGTLTYSPAVSAPSTPSVTSPNSNGTTTNDSTPSFTFSGAGGLYRCSIDDSGMTSPVVQTGTTFTPIAPLSDGAHTFYVQERNVAGTWSGSGGGRTFSVDSTAPYILSRVTKDTDATPNGQLDAIDVTFSEPMSGAQTGTWTVAGYAVGSPSWQSTTVLRLPLTELATPDTGALPAVRYTAGTVQDAAGNLFPVEGSGTAATDGAAPVIVAASGATGSSSLTITFSEPVVTTASGAGNLQAADFGYSGTGTSIVSLPDANGLDQVVTASTSAALTAGSDQVSALAASIYDLAGNAMGTAGFTITAPASAIKTVASGEWTNPWIWSTGTVPGYTDNISIEHPIYQSLNGSTYSYNVINNVTFAGSGTLKAAEPARLWYTTVAAGIGATSVTLTGGVNSFVVGDKVRFDVAIATIASSPVYTVTSWNSGTGVLTFSSALTAVVPISSTAYVAEPNSLADVANTSTYYIMAVAGHQVNVNITTSMNNVQFYDYTSSGDFFIRVAPGCTFTTNNVLQGHFSRYIVKQGTGTLVWNSPRNYYGGYDLGYTRIEAGKFVFMDNKTNPRPDGYDLTVFSGAVLDLRQNYAPLSLSGQGTIECDANVATNPTLTIGTSGSTWGGTIRNKDPALGSVTATMSVALNGANSWTGSNTFTGGLTINPSYSLAIYGTSAIADTCPVTVSGTLSVKDNETIGQLANPTTGTIQLSSRLTVNQGASAATVSGYITGSDGLTLASGSTATLSLANASNDYTGSTIISGGKIAIADSHCLGTGALVLDGGTLQATADLNLTAGAVATGTGVGFSAPGTAHALSVTANDGTIDMQSFSVAMNGFDTASGQDLTIAASATTNALFVNATGNATWAGLVKYPGAGTAFGYFSKLGAGSLLLAGANTWRKDHVAVEGGTLSLTNAAAFGTVNTDIKTYTGATLDLNAGSLTSAVAHILNGTLKVSSGPVTWNGTVNLSAGSPVISFPSAGQTADFHGATTFTAAWVVDGAGTLALSSATSSNTGSGAGTVKNGGAILISDATHLGTAALTLGGTGPSSSGSLLVTNDLTFGQTITLAGNGGIIDVAATRTLQLSQALAGTGSLTKNAAGTLRLNAAATHSQSATTVNGGTLQVSDYRQLGATGTLADITLNGGILAVTTSSFAATANGSSGTGRNLILTGNGSVDVASGITLTWPGVVSLGGTFAKTGSGTLVLSGTNTFTGPLVVSAGVVQATNASALGTSAGGTAVADLAVLQLSGSFPAFAEPLNLVGDGGSGGALQVLASSSVVSAASTVAVSPGVNGSATIAIASGSSASFGGVISGNGGLKEIGGGTLTLSGTNTFRGLVTVSGSIATPSTLQITGNAALGDNPSFSNQVLLDGGKLVPSATFSTSRTIGIGSNLGTIQVTSVTLTLNADLNTAAGQGLTIATLGTGTVQLTQAAAANSNLAGDLTLNPSTTFIISQGAAANCQISGSLKGSGSLQKTGAGIATFSGADTMTGLVTVSGGILRANGNHTSGAVTVASGGVLAGNGSVGAATVNSGGVIRPAGAATAGILTVASLDLQADALLDFDLGATNDLIVCTGTATVASSVDLTVTANGAFGDGSYTLISAAPTAGAGLALPNAGMTPVSLPNSYSTVSTTKRAVITSTASAIVLTTDQVAPAVTAITSSDPDGVYYVGDSFNVTVQFNKPITPTGAVTLNLKVGNAGGSVVTRSVALAAGADPTQLVGSYTVVSGDITTSLPAPGEVDANQVVVTGSVTDAVGHVVSATTLTVGGSTLSSNKNIIIDNHVPEIAINTGLSGDTQPAAVTMQTLEQRIFDPALNDATHVVVLASDQETALATQLVYRILLEPSQGVVQYESNGNFSSGGVQTVVTTVTGSNQVTTFTQDDINNARVRYVHTSQSGGNDAILINVTDADNKTSPLYLMRFAISSNLLPVITGLPTSMDYLEEATHAVWQPIAGSASVSSVLTTFPQGRLTFSVSPNTSGDSLDLLPTSTNVTFNGTQVRVAGVQVGTFSRPSGTSLVIDLASTAGPLDATAIINAIGYRNTEVAPDPTSSRSVVVTITDDIVAHATPSSYADVVTIRTYNDGPALSVPAPVPTVPGLARTIAIAGTDPEGELSSNLTFVLTSPPSYGVLTYLIGGAPVLISDPPFTAQSVVYTPRYLSAPLPTSNVVDDTFQITASDLGFSATPALPTLLDNGGTTVAPATATGTYTVRISAGAGGTVPTFVSAARMSVQPGLGFNYNPVVTAASNANLTFSLINDPGVDSFNTVNGGLIWNAVPAPSWSPKVGDPYYRFQILVVDDVNGTSAVQPVMLRVGTGGPG